MTSPNFGSPAVSYPRPVGFAPPPRDGFAVYRSGFPNNEYKLFFLISKDRAKFETNSYLVVFKWFSIHLAK